MNISTSQNLDPTLKGQIDRMVDIPSNQLVVILSAIELNSFQKERKDIFIKNLHDGRTTQIPLLSITFKMRQNLPI